MPLRRAKERDLDADRPVTREIGEQASVICAPELLSLNQQVFRSKLGSSCRNSDDAIDLPIVYPFLPLVGSGRCCGWSA